MKLDLSRYDGHTPGPWNIGHYEYGEISLFATLPCGPQDNNDVPQSEADANLLEDAPKLLARVKELESRLSGLLERAKGLDRWNESMSPEGEMKRTPTGPFLDRCDVLALLKEATP